MKKMPLIVLAVLFFTAFVSQSTSLTYVKGYETMEPNHPVTDPIIITVFSPTNQSIYYNSSNLTLEFNVTKPDSWFDPTYLLVGIIHEIYYTLDNNKTSLFIPDLSYNWYTDGLPKTSQYSIPIGNLSAGIHNLTIVVNATSSWMRYNDSGTFQDYQFVTLTTTSTIQFNVAGITPSPFVPEFSYFTILPILLTIPIAIVIVRKRLQRNV
jgi:hypothetical protein